MQSFNRFEFKYIIPHFEARAIKTELLLSGMQPDVHAAKNENHSYIVNSLYFDTPRFDDYADKAGGFLKRKKIRIRIYTPKLTPSTSEIWLEKKEKYEMVVSKRRMPLSHAMYDTLIRGPYLHALKGHHTFDELITQSMKPVMEVRYQREPLLWPTQQNLRITFDSHIEAAKNSDLRLTRLFHNVAPGRTVMEVKFLGALPFWFRKLLKEFDLRRSSFSKYVEAVETVYRNHPIPR